MPKIELKFRNTLVKGEKRYELLDAQMLSVDQVPAAYYPRSINKAIMFKERDNSIYYKQANIDCGFGCKIGSLFDEAELKRFLDIAQEAGNHLHEVNKDIRKLKEKWEGKEWTRSF